MSTFEPRELLRSVAPLVVGTGLAQLSTLAVLPLLTRLYGPADFGVLAFFASAATLGGLLVGGRYELAIPVPADDTEARELLRLATTLGLAVTAVSIPAAFALRAALSSVPRLVDVSPWIVWVPASLALTCLYQPLSYAFTREGRFQPIAVSRALQSTVAAITQLALGFGARAGAGGLVAGALAGQVAATVTLEATTRSDARLPRRIRTPTKGLRALARHYRDFPLFTTSAGLLQVASDQLPLLVIPLLFGASVAGEYALPARLLQAATMLVAAPAAQVFYPLAARQREAGAACAAALRMHRTLLEWTVTPVLLVALAAPELLRVTFGEVWVGSARYLRMLCPWFLAGIAYAPLSQLFLVFGTPHRAFRWQAALLVTSAGALLVGSRFGVMGAVLAFSLVGAVVRIAGVEAALRITGAAAGAGLAALGREGLRAGPFLAALALVRRLGSPAPVTSAITGSLVAIHAALLLRAERRSGART